MGRRLAAALVVLVVVTAGCMAPLATSGDAPSAEDRELGTINGYNATDTIDIEDPRALTEAELEALTYRTMARIEVLRELRFTEDVEVEIATREDIRERYDSEGDPASPFANERYRGTFLIDGDTDVNAAFDRLYGDAVAGFYTNNRIVLVVDDPDVVAINRDTFVHELVHALQDQQFGLERHGTTHDERQAETSLIEGEANYVPHLYAQECERNDQWTCYPSPAELAAMNDDDGDGDGLGGSVPEETDGNETVEAEFNVGLFLSIFAPYSEGPTFVQHLHDTQRWSGVDTAFDERPISTSQIIHPETYPDNRPAGVTVEDRSRGGWTPMTDGDGERETDTIGEATLFAALFANGAIDHDLTAGATEISPYNYSHPATAGWAGDTFVGYEAPGGEVGHVWALEWESDADAERFAVAYERLLANQGGEAIDGANDTYVIGDGDPFAGAYRVTVDGDRVVIVGGPTVQSLEAIHPHPEGQTTALEGAPTTLEAASVTGSGAVAVGPVPIGSPA